QPPGYAALPRPGAVGRAGYDGGDLHVARRQARRPQREPRPRDHGAAHGGRGGRLRAARRHRVRPRDDWLEHRRPAGGGRRQVPLPPRRARGRPTHHYGQDLQPAGRGAGAGGDEGPGGQPAHRPSRLAEARPALRGRRSAAGAGRAPAAHLPGHARRPRRGGQDAGAGAGGLVARGAEVQDALRVPGLGLARRRRDAQSAAAGRHLERARPEALQRALAERLARGGRGLVRAGRGDQAHGLGAEPGRAVAERPRPGPDGGRRAGRAADAARRDGHPPVRDPRGRPRHPADVPGVPTSMTDTPFIPSRRQALVGALGLGLSIEFLGRTALAADGAGSNRKLIVVICRGGMDGLSVSPPVGDPNYAALRGPIAIPGFDSPGGALKLDDTFGLHPALAATYRLALKGEARIAPAVATPDRERSHFEAQDVLENGQTTPYATDSGWLNRALQAMGPGKAKAISVGATAPLILRGPMEVASWSPGPGVGRDPRLPAILADLYQHDPLLSRALASGLVTEAA